VQVIDKEIGKYFIRASHSQGKQKIFRSHRSWTRKSENISSVQTIDKEIRKNFGCAGHRYGNWLRIIVKAS
jgi:hypothetical protein